jgi:hypothetical protein
MWRRLGEWWQGEGVAQPKATVEDVSGSRPDTVPKMPPNAEIPIFHPDALIKAEDGLVRYKDVQLGAPISKYPEPRMTSDGRAIYGEIIGEQSVKGGSLSDLFNSHPEGISIKGFTENGVDQVINAGVKPNAILNALREPIKIEEPVMDSNGVSRQEFVGREAEVVINLKTKRVVSVKPTPPEKVTELLHESGLMK